MCQNIHERTVDHHPVDRGRPEGDRDRRCRLCFHPGLVHLYPGLVLNAAHVHRQLLPCHAAVVVAGLEDLHQAHRVQTGFYDVSRVALRRVELWHLYKAAGHVFIYEKLYGQVGYFVLVEGIKLNLLMNSQCKIKKSIFIVKTL